MFEIFNKTSQLLPVKVNKNEEKLVPTVSDPQLLSQKRSELRDIVRKAAEDGEITKLEYDELCDLTTQVGINNFELNEMIRSEYKKSLNEKIKLFVEDDGVVDEIEMRNLISRAKEIGVSEQELKIQISEAISNYTLEQKRIQTEKMKVMKVKAKESTAKFAEKAQKLGKLLLAAGVATAVAYVGLKAQKQQVNNIAAKQGNYKVSLSTVMHKSARDQ
jgi:methyl coenzyme M reductase subunit C-like uncharacterized protein (methanogenesis marker protein 7)